MSVGCFPNVAFQVLMVALTVNFRLLSKPLDRRPLRLDKTSLSWRGRVSMEARRRSHCSVALIRLKKPFCAL